MRSYSVTDQNDFELEFSCDRCGHTGRVLIAGWNGHRAARSQHVCREENGTK